MAVRFQLRRDTSSNWTSTNPVLSAGEPAIETDTLAIKMGDGVTPWNSLDYVFGQNWVDIQNTPTTLAGYGITDAFDSSWSSLTGTPTTLSGYGITDAATSAQGALADSAIQSGDNISVLVNDSGYLTTVAFADLTSKPTTLSGYGITDTYTTAEVDSAISTAVSNLIDSAPGALDTLNELAAAIGDNANFSASVTTALGNRLRVDINSQNLTVDQKANAVTNLGLATVSTTGSYNDLSNTPTIPSNTNELTNGAGFITASSTETLTNKSGNISQWTNDSSYLTSVAFADLTATPTTLSGYGITDAATSTQGANADTAFGWGDHAQAGYLTSIGQVSINELSNVNSGMTPSDGQALVYNQTSSEWIAQTLSGTGTVTSVDISLPTGLEVAGNPITTTGTLAITYSTGFSLPTTAKQSEWDTAYGWGDHSLVGYLTSISGLNISGLTNDSGYLTAETDPIVGAITGIVKSDGAGNISAAVAGTDYSTFDGAFGSLTGTPTTISGYGITDAFDGNYSSLTGSPTNISTFTNDSGYLTTVAFADLTSKPTTLSGYGITDNVVVQGDVLVGDLKGSVFGDDSLPIIDGVTSTVRGDVNSANITVANLTTTGQTTIGGTLLPDTNETYDLGSATNKFRDLYLSSGTIYLGTSATISANNVSGGVILPTNTSIDGQFDVAKLSSLKSTNEVVQNLTPQTTTLSVDATLGSVIHIDTSTVYPSSIDLVLSNVTSEESRVSSFALIFAHGVGQFVGLNSLSINGDGLQTVNWLNGSPYIGTSTLDVVTLTIIRVNSAWKIIAGSNAYTSA